MIFALIGYFIYKGTESYIILFLSFSIPGLVVSLQSVQNSVMSEKNSGMFEKLLTVSRLDKILMLKAMVAFIFSAVVTLICSGAVFVFVSNSSSASIDSHAFLCESFKVVDYDNSTCTGEYDLSKPKDFFNFKK